MLIRILTNALLAGAFAGLVAAVLQLWFVQPVLLHAELYESGELTHFGAGAQAAAEAHGHGAGLSVMRDGLSVLFNMLIYAGYALILVALMSLAEERGARLDARRGLLWGIAGFVAVQLTPGFSLPPEVPGVAAADVEVRQVWWFATVLMAAVAIWLIAFGKGPLAWGAAVLLLIAPHMVGAPEPDAFAGPVPPEISALFVARVFGVALAGWAVMGVCSGWLWSRDDQTNGKTQTA